MSTVVSASGLGKRYLIKHTQERYATFREALSRTAAAAGRRLLASRTALRRQAAVEAFWALKDVSFDVSEGQRVGIIGRNGAGKSTLLKLLSRITDPTEGRVSITGRVASLLEVGTGFHPELTGRENVFLNGAILGMTKTEIRAKFDEIVAFAEVERFLDTPVKRYSSGMYVRLAFAVAAHVEPEILIVDEVLAVGDTAFQKKCLSKMEETGREGRTVLFVSHNMGAIRALCDRGMLLQAGRLIEAGPIDEVVRRYSTELAGTELEFPLAADDLVVRSFQIVQGGRRTDHIDGDTSFEVAVEFDLLRDLRDFRLGLYVRSGNGENVMRTFLADWDPGREALNRGRYRAAVDIPAELFVGGEYLVELHASRYGVRDYLAGHSVQTRITVDSPLGFNAAHRDEKVMGYVLNRNDWSLKRHV